MLVFSHRGVEDRDAPDIRPFLISGIRPETSLPCRISGKAGKPDIRPDIRLMIS
jgi:hypothetical protein